MLEGHKRDNTDKEISSDIQGKLRQINTDELRVRGCVESNGTRVVKEKYPSKESSRKLWII